MLQVLSHDLVLMFFNLCLGSWPHLCSLLSLIRVEAILSEIIVLGLVKAVLMLL